MSNFLLSCIPDAQRIDLSHNANRCESASLRHFIREGNLASKFPSRAELRLSLDRNEIWLLEMQAPGAEARVFAAARFPSLIALARREATPRDENIVPPFPRHDFGLHLTGVKMGDLGERLRMTWHEVSPAFGTMLECRSLDVLLIRALQAYARSAAETVAAVQRVVR